MDRLTTDEYSKVDKYWKLNRESRFDVERVRLFDYFNLNLKDKNVLEMAAGATGRISKFLHSKESNLTISDGRMVNIKSNIQKNNFSDVSYHIADYDKEDSIDKKYDVIFCCGLLYHLNNIENTVKSIGENCNDYAIISTCVKSKNKPSTLYDDDINNYSQALNGKGLSFSRETLKEELHKYFKYVCVPYYLPNDPSHFDLTWPTTRKGFHRQIFFVTNDKKFIDESKFSYDLLNEYKFLI